MISSLKSSVDFFVAAQCIETKKNAQNENQKK